MSTIPLSARERRLLEYVRSEDGREKRFTGCTPRAADTRAFDRLSALGLVQTRRGVGSGRNVLWASPARPRLVHGPADERYCAEGS